MYSDSVKLVEKNVRKEAQLLNFLITKILIKEQNLPQMKYNLRQISIKLLSGQVN